MTYPRPTASGDYSSRTDRDNKYPTPAPAGAGQPGSAGDQSGGGHRRFRRRGPFSRLLHRGQPTGARAASADGSGGRGPRAAAGVPPEAAERAAAQRTRKGSALPAYRSSPATAAPATTEGVSGDSGDSASPAGPPNAAPSDLAAAKPDAASAAPRPSGYRPQHRASRSEQPGISSASARPDPGPAGHRRGQRAPRSRAGGPGVPRWLPPGRGTGTGFVPRQRPSRAGHQPDAPVSGIGTVTGGGARAVCGLGSGPGRRSRSAPERDGPVPGPARAPDARWLRTVRAAVRHARADVRVLHGFVGRAAHWVIRGLRAGRSTAWAVPRGRPGTGSQRAGRPGSGRQPAVPGPDRAGPARPHAGRDPAPGRGEAGEPRGRRRAAEAPLPDRPPGHPDAPQQREPAGAGGS